MKIENLVLKPQYNSILLLLELYDKDGKGLRQQHFRYALMENSELPENKKKFFKNKFFGKSLKYFQNNFNDKYRYDENSTLLILKGCVKNRVELSQFLERLVRYDLIKKNGKHPEIRYHLTNKYWMLRNRMIKELYSKRIIEKCVKIKDKKIMLSLYNRPKNLNKKNDKKIDYLTHSYWLLEGMPTDIEKMNIITKSNKLKSCLRNIDENLFIISDILSKQNDNESIGFYFICEPILEKIINQYKKE